MCTRPWFCNISLTVDIALSHLIFISSNYTYMNDEQIKDC